MFENYFKLAWRNLLKNRVFSFIHIAGLTLGIALCLLLGAYIVNEQSYDRFHKNVASIYRVNTDLIMPEQRLELSLASGKIGPELKKDFPQVEAFTRISKMQGSLAFKKDQRAFFEKNVVFADPAFFSMFSFPLLQGNETSVLEKPNQIVLTPTLVQKYFGNENPVGQSLVIDNEPYEVSGVAAIPPQNSHIRFDAVISYATWLKKNPYTEQNWEWFPTTTYVQLQENTLYKNLDAKLDTWLKAKRLADKDGSQIHLSLQPFTQIHFGAARLGDLQPTTSKGSLWLLIGIGAIVLLLALFNFINLATAVNADRAKEIGVLKTFGAEKKQIAFQFLTESVLLSFVATAFAFLLATALLPSFSNLVQQDLKPYFNSPSFLIIVFGTTLLIIGPAAGFYPAFVVSKFKTAAIFKNNAGLGLERVRVRRFLIALQFVISIALISCTLIIQQQHHYLLTRQMGFSQANKLVIRMGDAKNLPVRPQVIKEALLQVPGVNGVSLSSHMPAEQLHGVETVVQRASGSEARAELELNLIDFDFMKLYGLQLVAGRPFSPSFAQDSVGALIVNETAVKVLGFKNPQEIIGQSFSQWERKGKVIGVIKDFNQHSLQTKIGPVTFQVNPELYEKITVAYNGNAPSVLKKIERTWKAVTGNAPFDYTFLDTWLHLQYEAEQRTATIFFGFSALAIFIACLGLYGLTMVSVKKRTKEIGIRKVLGASVNGLVGLLSKDFFKLVLIAFIIAAPLAWYFMNKWLQDFAYGVNIQWWMFVASGLLVLLVAMATVSVQAIKAALENPVKNLRTE